MIILLVAWSALWINSDSDKWLEIAASLGDEEAIKE